MPTSYSEFLFSANGRISRSQFWLRWVLPYIVVSIVVMLVFQLVLPPSVASILVLIYFLVALWPTICVYIKRAHDRGRSGAFILLFLIPIVSLWPFIELCFLPGTMGANEYGPDPVAV